MALRAKYIITEHEMPMIFSEWQNHADVARWVFGDRPIIGAGFVYVTQRGDYSCYGESITLRVKSRGEEDAKILNKMLGGANVQD